MEKPNILTLNTKVGGEVKYTLYDQDENGNLTLVHETDWDSQVIVDTGLGNPTLWSNWYSYFTIGSDGTAATVADTSIGNLLFNKQSGTNTRGPAGVPPDYAQYEIRTVRFEVGEGTGTVREFTVGRNNSGTSIWCRHVVSPEIVKAANQVLDVAYRLTIWPNVNDVNGTVTIDGVVYDTIVRMLNVDSGSISVFGQWGGSFTSSQYNNFDGDLGLITDFSPQGDGGVVDYSGTITWGGGGILDAGVSGYRDSTINYDLDYGNAPLGVRTTKLIIQPHAFNAQVQFNAQGTNARIPKDNTKVMAFTWRQTWSRH